MENNPILFCPRCGNQLAYAYWIPEPYTTPIQGIDKRDQLGGTCEWCGYHIMINSHLEYERYQRIKYMIARGEASYDGSTDEILTEEFFDQYLVPNGREHAMEIWFFMTYVKPLGLYDKSNFGALRRMRAVHLVSRQYYLDHGGREYEEERERKRIEEREPIGFVPYEKPTRQVTCPYCGSTSVTKITDLQKGVNIALFGLMALPSVQGNWKCNKCKSRF